MDGTTAKERKALAKKAAAARWSSAIKHIAHGDDDHPLRIGRHGNPCYVLEDETRVLRADRIGMSTSGGAPTSAFC